MHLLMHWNSPMSFSAEGKSGAPQVLLTGDFYTSRKWQASRTIVTICNCGPDKAPIYRPQMDR